MATTKTTTTTKKKNTVPEVLADVIVSEGACEKLDLSKTTEGQVKLDDSVSINVKSNVFGKLTYIDKKTQDEVVWHHCGEVNPMSLGMLRSMKATAINFFKNQWVIITGFADENADTYTTADIYKALMIGQYYKDLIEPSDYAAVCAWEPEDIKKKVSLMSTEAKANLAVALNTYIEKGILDSLKRIKAFEEVLGCELKIPE